MRLAPFAPKKPGIVSGSLLTTRKSPGFPAQSE